MGGLTPLALIGIIVGGLAVLALLAAFVTVIVKKTSKAVDRKNP